MKKVSDYMTTSVRLLTPDMRLSEAARLLVMWRVSGAPVIDEAHRVIGVVSFADMAAHSAGVDIPALPLSDFYQSVWVPEELKPSHFAQSHELVRSAMTTRIVSVLPESSLKVAAELLLEEQVHRLIVCSQEGNAVGILSTVDLTRALLDVLQA